MGNKWIGSLKELKKVSFVATPMVVVTVLLYLLQVVSVMLVGHLDDDISLSAVGIASSFTSATGYGLLFGMAGALETLCGQAYGAEQYEKLGTFTYCAIFSLVMVCVPISIMWIFTDKLLLLIGQDPSISRIARQYSVYLIPNLFAYAVLQALIRYFQTQSLIHPMVFSSLATMCFHIPVSWALVFKAELGSKGAALGISLSYWLNVFLLLLYMKCSSKCQKTLGSFTTDVFLSTREFFRFAIPSAIMTCLEWWSYEVLILLSGLFPNPKVETSVLSICFTITYLLYYIPYGFGATVSTRVSNELGAGNPEAAKMAVRAIMVLAIAELVITASVLFSIRHILGNIFSSQKEIVDHIANMAPFFCLSVTMDSLQTVLSGVVRGSGWQRIGAYTSLVAYYMVGIPVAVILAFVAHLRGKGLLIGLATGSGVQATILALLIVSTNWQQQAEKVRERIPRGESEGQTR